MPTNRSRIMSSVSLEEKRTRNLSLVSANRHSASPLPGFSAYLGSITRHSTGQKTFHPFGLNEPLSPQNCFGVFSSMYCETPSEYSFRPMFEISDTPPIVSPEPDDDILNFTEFRKKESSSSGYGSGGSDDQISISEHSDDSRIRSRFRYRKHQHEEASRRKSMPPQVRAFENDVTRVLCNEGHAQLETDVDTGEAIRCSIRGMSRPESVLQLARKFGEISAAQQNDLHKSRQSLLQLPLIIGKENAKKPATTCAMSRSGPPTPIRHGASSLTTSAIGGIASLKSEPKMSRPNMFKQMEKVGNGTAVGGPPRVLNPNSIKDALLRWIQNRVQGYPNVNVTNFSSSWADGMAFCALIHRFAPDAFDFNSLDPKNRRYNLDLAFKVAEENGIFPLLEVDDMIMMGDRPDWKCVFTYVQSFYKQFRDRP
ncbi:unnamed protein product [Caenorhabditis bovis]|uniref:Calponin-homology (CH) domain-containing protein n=1 Tax=Caenorhabditis bovis TaxID=2654633 RepID=A0A8S1ERF7_9PELO|nr:unnamed protein product [Caenorhabditis bovis]